MNSSQKAVLTRLVSGTILWDASLSAWTTYRIGGPADALVTLLDVQDLRRVLDFCRLENIAWKLLGRGSNVLASDDGFRGIVMVLGDEFKKITGEPKQDGGCISVTAGAAVSMTKLANWCGAEGYAGIEFAAGIPGTIGGAVVMNAGAWGGSIADVLDAIEVTDCQKSEIVRAKNLTFSYRKCHYPGIDKNESVITGITLNLVAGDPLVIRETMRNLQARRKERQPYEMPNAGSVFKNPGGASAGKLIDDSGLKGLRVGDAEVSEKHANFIINRGNALASDVRSLIVEIQNRVRQNSGVELEPEIEIL